jgi:hypothetical protein
MAEENLIDDVRAAKAQLHAEYPTWETLREHLRSVEEAWRNRTGEFAGVPRAWPESVLKAIESAPDEPGREFLEESRSTRRK